MAPADKSPQPPLPLPAAESGEGAGAAARLSADADRRLQSSSLISKNVKVAGKRTSFRFETLIWESLEDIAAREHMSVHELCTLIEQRHHDKGTLTSAVRVFIIEYYKYIIRDYERRFAPAEAEATAPPVRPLFSNIGLEPPPRPARRRGARFRLAARPGAADGSA